MRRYRFGSILVQVMRWLPADIKPLTDPMATSWWRHQMETFSALLDFCAGNFPVTGEFPTERPVTRSFDVLFDLHLKKRLSKQSRRQWFETPSCSLWHCNDYQKDPCYWPEGIFIKRSKCIDHITTRVQIMAWRRPQKTGFIFFKMASLFSRGQWVKVTFNTPDI